MPLQSQSRGELFGDFAMTNNSDDTPLAKFGESLTWAIARAFRTFASEQPEAAANLWAGVESREVRLEVTTAVGGHEAGRITVTALLPDGEKRLLASMHVESLKVN
jgi:hypothetical protein